MSLVERHLRHRQTLHAAVGAALSVALDDPRIMRAHVDRVLVDIGRQGYCPLPAPFDSEFAVPSGGVEVLGTAIRAHVDNAYGDDLARDVLQSLHLAGYLLHWREMDRV